MSERGGEKDRDRDRERQRHSDTISQLKSCNILPFFFFASLRSEVAIHPKTGQGLA